MMPLVQISKGNVAVGTVQLDRPVMGIGRSSDNEIALPEQFVSRHHARVVRCQDGDHLEDLGSYCGTLVDGRPLRPGLRLLLIDGLEFRIGNYTFIYRDPGLNVVEGDSTILKTIDVVSGADAPPSLSAQPEETLRAVLEIGRCLGGTLDLHDLFDAALNALLTIFPLADRCLVILRDPDDPDDSPRLEAFRSRSPETGPGAISRVVLEHVLDRGLALLSDDTATDPRFDQSASVLGSGIRSILSAPILDRRRRPVGLVQIDVRRSSGRFNVEDLNVLASVVGQLGAARDAARLHEALIKQEALKAELRAATTVQRAMLPEEPPRIAGYTLWHRYIPAREVGGDFFCYVPQFGLTDSDRDRPPQRWALAIGDVAGKGMPAALLVAKLAAEVQLSLAAEPDPAGAMTRLNRRFCEAAITDEFITFLLLVLDADHGRLSVVRAGHTIPMVRRFDGRIEEADEEPAGPPLGVVEGYVYEAAELEIGPGDVVVLYTDGISEAPDTAGRLFGIENLGRAIAPAAAFAGSVGEAILQAVDRYSADACQRDDIALICVGRDRGESSETPADHPSAIVSRAEDETSTTSSGVLP